MRLAKNKPHVVIASSSSVYGHSDLSLLSEENDLIIKSAKHPLWNYALSKIANETLALAYYQTANIPVTIIRLFNTIGPRQTGQYGMVVQDLSIKPAPTSQSLSMVMGLKPVLFVMYGIRLPR